MAGSNLHINLRFGDERQSKIKSDAGKTGKSESEFRSGRQTLVGSQATFGKIPKSDRKVENTNYSPGRTTSKGQTW